MAGKKLIYSLKWAQTVVQKLKEAHARATDFLLEETGITERKLTIWLASGSKEYYVVREMVRFIDKALKCPRNHPEADYLAQNTTRLLSLFKARLEQFDCETGFLALTGIQLCLNLEEPVIKGAEEGAVPPSAVPAMVDDEQGLLGGGLNIEISY